MRVTLHPRNSDPIYCNKVDRVAVISGLEGDQYWFLDDEDRKVMFIHPDAMTAFVLEEEEEEEEEESLEPVVVLEEV